MTKVADETADIANNSLKQPVFIPLINETRIKVDLRVMVGRVVKLENSLKEGDWEIMILTKSFRTLL